jgi:zinc transport system ATP-binding protein
MNHKELAIEARDIGFKSGGATILENVTFNVYKGDYLGIIGPNGGGKTTLIKIMLGLLKPAWGTVKIFGQDIEDFRDRAAIGYVPQKAAETENRFPATVEEIISMGRTARIGLFRSFSHADKKAVREAMEIAGVTGLKDKLISSLSGGERQRVYIARALAGQPQILFMDEPTLAIDITSQEKFYDFLDHLNQKLGLTILFVSHDIAAVAKKVKTVLCLNREMVCHGSPAQFMKDEYLERLYGKKVNLIMHQH